MATKSLSDRIGSEVISSRLYQTPSFPPGSGPDYANAAIRAVTSLESREILNLLHEIEAEFGRIREARWGQRTLDLDLIAVEDEIAPDEATVRAWMDLPLEQQKVEAPDRMILPHPRMQDRAFVLVPLAEVAADWRHPILGLSVREMLDRLPEAEKAEIKVI